jgi:hypothetical protein
MSCKVECSRHDKPARSSYQSGLDLAHPDFLLTSTRMLPQEFEDTSWCCHLGSVRLQEQSHSSQQQQYVVLKMLRFCFWKRKYFTAFKLLSLNSHMIPTFQIVLWRYYKHEFMRSFLVEAWELGHSRVDLTVVKIIVMRCETVLHLFCRHLSPRASWDEGHPMHQSLIHWVLCTIYRSWVEKRLDDRDLRSDAMV